MHARIKGTFFSLAWISAMAPLALLLGGCGGGAGETLKIAGSDTMVNLSAAWAEQYMQQYPDVDVQVTGGGSGTGIAKLIDGTVDMANASRDMNSDEKKSITDKHGREPVETTVALDALAVYVHKDNPLETISLEEVAEIYGEGGTITNWSQLGGPDSEITRVGRQNNSGTYVYFREHVLGEGREYKQGSYDQSGSKDVVGLVGKTPSAIGYSGMGYATDEVKMLPISEEKGGQAVAPTLENAKSGVYPLARALYIYTVGEPAGAAKHFIDWTKSAEGQAIVVKVGYVPIEPEKPAADQAPPEQ